MDQLYTKAWKLGGWQSARIRKMTVTKKIPASKGAGVLNRIKTTGSGLKPRICVAGVEGIGKSSFPVWAKNPIFLMSQGETGIL